MCLVQVSIIIQLKFGMQAFQQEIFKNRELNYHNIDKKKSMEKWI